MVSIYLEAMGRHEEAIQEAERARQLNPLSLGTNVNLAWQLYQAGLDDQPIRQLEEALELDPNFWGTHWAILPCQRTSVHQGNVADF